MDILEHEKKLDKRSLAMLDEMKTEMKDFFEKNSLIIDEVTIEKILKCEKSKRRLLYILNRSSFCESFLLQRVSNLTYCLEQLTEDITNLRILVSAILR